MSDRRASVLRARAVKPRRHEAVRRLALWRLRGCGREGSGNGLRAFHARYKYLLMACSPQRTRLLGRIAARAKTGSSTEAFADYERELMATLAQPPTAGGHENALLHMFGYVSPALAPAERSRFLAELAEYRRGTGSLAAPVIRLHEWIAHQDVAYLENQSYFEALLRVR